MDAQKQLLGQSRLQERTQKRGHSELPQTSDD